MTDIRRQSMEVLETIRRTHDTVKMNPDLFPELCQATLFYLKGGFSVEQTAKLVIEELFTNVEV